MPPTEPAPWPHRATSSFLPPSDPSLPVIRVYPNNLMPHQIPDSPSIRTCFVTTGLTAPFPLLIKAVLSRPFLHALSTENYRHLDIQYGNQVGQKCFDEYLWALNGEDGIWADYGIDVTGFGYEKKGLKDQLVRARESEGFVVSHAGSGSILDTLRVGAPLLVVPNPELMDNHQVELAEVLEAEKYVVHGKLDDLADGVTKVEELRLAMREWPPVTAKDKKGGLVKVVEEEMRYLD